MQTNNQSEKIRIRKERDFKPHHILIYAASVGLMDAEKVTKEEKGLSLWTPHELTAIIFSAFALEAIGNSFGEKFVKRWKDFEYSSPIAKLRIVCNQLNIEPDFQQEPWSSAQWLIKFRNDVAHARPFPIKTDEVVHANEYFLRLHTAPLSDVEKQITLGNAKQAVNTVQEILDQFYLKIKPDERGGLFFDGSSGSASVC
jgi:hypothetical protein